jgi:hypothetical protein
MPAGSAINDAVVEQNFRKARRLTPWLWRSPPRVGSLGMTMSPLVLIVFLARVMGLAPRIDKGGRHALHAAFKALRGRLIKSWFSYGLRIVKKPAPVDASNLMNFFVFYWV